MKPEDLALTAQWQTPADSGAVVETMFSINANGNSAQKSRLVDLTHEVCGVLADIYKNQVATQGDMCFDEAARILSSELKQHYPLMQDRIAQHEASGFLRVIGYK